MIVNRFPYNLRSKRSRTNEEFSTLWPRENWGEGKIKKKMEEGEADSPPPTRVSFSFLNFHAGVGKSLSIYSVICIVTCNTYLLDTNFSDG